jgi:hypothetical protein
MSRPEYLKIVRYNPRNQNTGKAKNIETNAAIKTGPLIKKNLSKRR